MTAVTSGPGPSRQPKCYKCLPWGRCSTENAQEAEASRGGCSSAPAQDPATATAPLPLLPAPLLPACPQTGEATALHAVLTEVGGASLPISLGPAHSLQVPSRLGLPSRHWTSQTTWPCGLVLHFPTASLPCGPCAGTPHPRPTWLSRGTTL